MKRLVRPPPAPLPEPFAGALGFWSYWASLAGIWTARHAGIGSRDIAAARLRDLVAFARESSPWYRQRLARLPRGEVVLADIPPTGRAELMAHFDAACTDRRVKRADVERFVADRSRVGELFLGRYHVWKSSGSTGLPGLFVHDAQALAVYEALVAMQLETAPLDPARLLAGGGRSALVVATGDHYASIASWEHLRRTLPGMPARSFPVLAPIDRLERELEALRPAFLASYPSMLSLLAARRRAGGLRIAPALLWSGGETLTPAARASIEETFACPVVDEYGASECLAIAHGCREGWLHVNDEWVMLEPIDRHGRPTPPGGTSDTVLVTNLANRVQPIIRYDLGDRVTLAPGPCACANPAPAMRVEGRAGQPLALRDERGRMLRLPPLALETVVEQVLGPRRFQVVQVAADRLLLRLDAQGGATARAAAGRRATRALRDWLATQSLPGVRVALDGVPPCPDPRSGKLTTVVVAAPCRTKAPA